MAAKRARRILLIAFAASLLLHLTFAFAFRWPSPRESQPQAVATLAVTHVVRIQRAPRSTPPPRAPRVASPPPSRARPAVALVRPAERTSRAAAGAAAAKIAAAPVPTAAPSAACERPDAPAALAGLPPPAQIAPGVRAQGISGTTRVAVRLNDQGSVVDARVVASSGSISLDAAAATMAKGATYAPAYVRCKGVASAYTFSVKWSAW